MNSTTRSEGLTLVLGGTGKIGRRVVERLASRDVQTRVASRAGDPPFDWGEQSTWDAVLDAVTAAYISYAPTSPSRGRRTPSAPSSSEPCSAGSGGWSSCRVAGRKRRSGAS